MHMGGTGSRAEAAKWTDAVSSQRVYARYTTSITAETYKPAAQYRRAGDLPSPTPIPYFEFIPTTAPMIDPLFISTA